MKKIYLVFCCLLFSFSSFGQQFLWSTANSTSSKYIPIEEVNEEILKFYDHYELYLDGAGYNKDSFFKEIGKYGGSSSSWINFKNEIRKIEELTVFAIRTNSGKGSEVMVLFITKDNINVVVFTNSYETGSNICIAHKRDKFTKWLETLKE